MANLIFPTNYLQTSSQPWARFVEKNINDLKLTVESNEINNEARDSQLAANYKRLDSAVTELTATTAKANAAATKAQEAIDALGKLDEATSTYKINAANVTVGSLSGDRISGGTITGTTLETASTGRRVKISGTTATFYDESSNYTGTITVSGYANESVMTINGPFTSRSISFSSINTYIAGGGGTYIDLSDEPRINLGGDTTITGALTINDGISGSLSVSSGISAGANITTTGAFSSTGQLACSGGTFNGTALVVDPGYIRCLDTYYRNTTGGLDVRVASNGTYFSVSSSRRFKQQIQDYIVDQDKFLAMNPVKFKYNYEVNEVGDAAGTAIGFIAEELEDLGLTEYVVYDNDGLPYGINYTEMIVGIKQILASQNNAIKSLTSRIEQLEGK